MANEENGGCTSENDLVKSLADQVAEALGPVNVWYFKEKYPWVLYPTDAQLVEYYIKNGGAAGHRQREIAFRAMKEEERRRESLAQVSMG